MPESRRPWSRVTDSRKLPRTVSHVAVAGLVVLSVFVGLAAGTGAVDGRGFFEFVSVARGAGAGDNILEAVGAHYEFAPDPNDQPDAIPERRITTIEAAPTPLPTPVPPNRPRPSVVYAAPQVVTGNGMLLWPVAGGRISQYYSSSHRALDIAAPYGNTVMSSDAGTVIQAGWKSNGGGLVLTIDHGNGIVTVYNHLGQIWVTAGQSVSRGQGIAAVGCTGVCTGPHVHYVVQVDGVTVNPLRYL